MKITFCLIFVMLVSIPLFCNPDALSSTAATSTDTDAKNLSIDMVYVEGGTFTMGDPKAKAGALEEPAHPVTVASFYLGKFEVTQKIWEEVMGYNNSHWKGDDLPIQGVSYYECLDFCNKLSLMEGLTPCYSGKKSYTTCDWSANGYRMPTEAEWEFACKGGTQSKNYSYSGSNNIDAVAWYKTNSGKMAHPVGQKQANELGIYDMSGNLGEWCWDWMDPNYFKKEPMDNPRGAKLGIFHLVRGGSWNSKEKFCHVAKRDSFEPDHRYSREKGFRLCRSK
jgi:formylglycine-generating enzyme required for sulfatase activity